MEHIFESQSTKGVLNKVDSNPIPSHNPSSKNTNDINSHKPPPSYVPSSKQSQKQPYRGQI